MKNNILLPLLLVITFSFSACSPQQNSDETQKNEHQASQDKPSMKTYKSNLYGFQFNYPTQYSSSNEGYPMLPKYSSMDITLDTIGMENFSNGNEVFGVEFRVPYHSYDQLNTMNFWFEVLTANEKLANLAPGGNLTQEDIDQEAKSSVSQKLYSQQEVYKYANISYQADNQNGNFKRSDSIDEISLAGKKAYQYRMTSMTVDGHPSDLYIFVSDGKTIYKIIITDSPLMREILSSLKFKS